MSRLLRTGVCVLGGGPAGATVARRLAVLGHQVSLVERAPFPRRRIGESLPPSLRATLATAGVLERVEAAGFLRPESSLIRWQSEDVIEKAWLKPAFHVDRGRFDLLLLEAAREVGVHILQPARARTPVRLGSDGVLVPLSPDAGIEGIEAAFVVDATGKNPLSPGQRRRCSAHTMALHGYWHPAHPVPPGARVEAGQDCWYWGAGLPDSTFSAAVFIDAERFASLGSGGLETLYRRLLVDSHLLAFCLKGRLDGDVLACDASSYVNDEPVGPRSLKTGEAAFSIDPLSSQGVQVAMTTAQQAAAVVHTLLRRPEHTEVALEFYRCRLAEAVERSGAQAAALYAKRRPGADGLFWKQREARPGALPPLKPNPPRLPPLQARLRLHERARLVPMPVLTSEFIVPLPALEHPSLERPVAFLGGHALAPLLSMMTTARTQLEILQLWTQAIPLRECQRVVGWLFSQGILVEV